MYLAASLQILYSIFGLIDSKDVFVADSVKQVSASTSTTASVKMLYGELDCARACLLSPCSCKDFVTERIDSTSVACVLDSSHQVLPNGVWQEFKVPGKVWTKQGAQYAQCTYTSREVILVKIKLSFLFIFIIVCVL